MKIGVSGASGHLGKAVMAELKARGPGHSLVGVSRTPETVQSAEARRGDFDYPATLVTAYEGLDRLLVIPSADVRPGIRDRHFAAAIDAAVDVGVGHIVMISSAATRQGGRIRDVRVLLDRRATSHEDCAAVDHPADELLR